MGGFRPVKLRATMNALMLLTTKAAQSLLHKM